MAGTQPCTLYYNPMSICSSMVRYTLSERGARREGSLPLSIELKDVQIFKGEQLTEEYLCDVNPKGQVPVLVSPGYLERPIPDSLEITNWLCDTHPSLRPTEHKADIIRLLEELHALNFFALSMRNVPERAGMLEQQIRDKMNSSGLADRHKKALEYKLSVTHSEKVGGVKPEVVKSEIERARALLSEIDKIRNSNKNLVSAASWIFGTTSPTALDTTLICLLARFMDVKLTEIVPATLLELTEKVRETKEFQDVWTSLPS